MKIIHSLASMVLDNDGRRSGADRRVFAYAVCVPERRNGRERRLRRDRRQNRRLGLDSSMALRRPVAFSY